MKKKKKNRLWQQKRIDLHLLSRLLSPEWLAITPSAPVLHSASLNHLTLIPHSGPVTTRTRWVASRRVEGIDRHSLLERTQAKNLLEDAENPRRITFGSGGPIWRRRGCALGLDANKVKTWPRVSQPSTDVTLHLRVVGLTHTGKSSQPGNSLGNEAVSVNFALRRFLLYSIFNTHTTPIILQDLGSRKSRVLPVRLV